MRIDPVDTSGDLGTILGVWAHPDDEAYLTAGLMAIARDAGRRVVCVTATRGEAGFPPDDTRSPAERSALRTAELAECLRILGVTEHRWLEYPDGGCGQVPDAEAIDRVAAIVEEVRPDTVLTFGPDGGTGHSDHIAAHRWATAAFGRVAPSGARLLYATRTTQWVEMVGLDRNSDDVMMVPGLRSEAVEPDALAVQLTCSDPILDRKIAALRAQRSQVEGFERVMGEAGYRALNREEAFRSPRPEDPERMAAVLGMPGRPSL